MEKDWLKLLHDAADNIDDDAADVKSIAAALRRVGNDRLAKELLEVAYRLKKTEADIRDATSLKTTRDVNDAFAMSRTILSSCLITSGMSEDKVRKRRGLTR